MIKIKCKIDDCTKFVASNGLCSAHYTRLRKHGDVNFTKRRRNGSGTVSPNNYIYIYKPGHPNAAKNGKILEHIFVMSESIKRKIEKNEIVTHINGNTTDNRLDNLVLSIKNTKCTIDNCKNDIYRLDMCSRHYRRKLKYNDPHKLLVGRSETGLCSVMACDRVHEARGFCVKHYLRFKKYGVTSLPIKERRPQITKEGYKLIYAPEHNNSNGIGYISEHRLVMSRHIGRDLLDDENVHHKDGNRLNNDISNLELWSTYQPSGQRVQDKIKWAEKIIDLYRDLIEKNKIDS